MALAARLGHQTHKTHIGETPLSLCVTYRYSPEITWLATLPAELNQD